MELDIIIPTYNEEGNIKNFYNETQKILKDIKHNYIFIDDGSTDKTFEELEEIYKTNDNNIKVISFSRNFGKEAAMYAGLQYSKAKIACIIDLDIKQNLNYLLKMYNFLKENSEYDSICMCQKQKKKKFFQHLFYKLIKKMSNLEIIEGASDFRMFRRNVVLAINKISEKNRFTKGIFSYIGFNTYYDYYDVEYSKSIKSKKIPLNYLFDALINSKPLRAATWTGLFISIISFLYLIAIIIKIIIKGVATIGYSPITCIILFLGGIHLIFIGILGEYLGKTYNEAKNRPIFISKRKLGFDEDIL